MGALCDWWHRSCRHMSVDEAIKIAQGGYIKNWCGNLTIPQIRKNWPQNCKCCNMSGAFNHLVNPYPKLPDSGPKIPVTPPPTPISIPIPSSLSSSTSKSKSNSTLPTANSKVPVTISNPISTLKSNQDHKNAVFLDSSNINPTIFMSYPISEIEEQQYVIMESAFPLPEYLCKYDTVHGDVLVHYGPQVKCKYRQMVIYTHGATGFRVGFAIESTAKIPHTLAIMARLMAARKITVKNLVCHFSTDRYQVDGAWNTVSCLEQADLMDFRLTFSSPDNHAQNAIAENSMLWMRRCLRKVLADKDPDLVVDLWWQAAFDCIGKDNVLLPSRSNPKMSRYEAFYGVMPDLGLNPFARWGAKVTVANLPNGAAKLPAQVDRGVEGFIVQSLMDYRQAFRIFNQVTNATSVTRSIRFENPPLNVDSMDPVIAATAKPIVGGSPCPIFITDEHGALNPELINMSLTGMEIFKSPVDSSPILSPIPPVDLTVLVPLVQPEVPYVREPGSLWYRDTPDKRHVPDPPPDVDPEAFIPVINKKKAARKLKLAINPSTIPLTISDNVQVSPPSPPQLTIPSVIPKVIRKQKDRIPATYPNPYKSGVPKSGVRRQSSKSKPIVPVPVPPPIIPLAEIPKPAPLVPASLPPSILNLIKNDIPKPVTKPIIPAIRKSSRQQKKVKAYSITTNVHVVARSIPLSPSSSPSSTTSYSYSNENHVLIDSSANNVAPLGAQRNSSASGKSTVRPVLPTEGTFKKMCYSSNILNEIKKDKPLQSKVFCYLTSLLPNPNAPAPGVYPGAKATSEAPSLTDSMISDIRNMRIPESLSRAKKFDTWPLWAKEVAKEMHNFHSNNKGPALSKEELPLGATIIHCKFIFDIKLLPSGLLDKLKCRLVALGNLQKDGSFDDVYAPTAMSKTSFLFLNIINAKNMHHGSVDVAAAFLTAKLDRVMYLKLPKEYTDGKDVYYLLTQSLYGLRQAAHLFNKELHELLISKNYVQSLNDPCLYSIRDNDGEYLHVCAHVDDLLYGSTSMLLCDQFVKDIRSKYNATHTPDTTSHCGILITRDRVKQTLLLSMPGSIDGALSRFRMADCKIRSSPGISSVRTAPSKGLADKVLFSEMVGVIRYIADRTHPEILYPAFELATNSQAPTLENMADARNVFRYLKGVKDHGILFSGNSLVLEVYCDASFNSGPKGLSHWATSYHLGSKSGCFHAESKRMKYLSLSSTDAEYVGLYNASKETVYQRSILEDFGIPQLAPTEIFQDNAQTIIWGNKRPKHQAGKHLDLKLHYVNECVERKETTLSKTPTADMRPDLNTKNTKTAIFTHLMPLMTRPSTVTN